MFSYVVDDELQLAIPRPALDAGPLYTLIAADRSTFERYLPWVKDTQTAADEQAALTLFNQHFGVGKSANLVLVVAGQPAGMISFNGFYPNRSADIGYWLGQPFRGHGVMHRAVMGMCALGFSEYGLNKIVIRAAVENQASNAVAKEATFHLDGTLRQDEQLLDGFHDENVWSKLKSEWVG
ncbi:GNAT family N-acetyltransferase [Lacticaseibacillus hegangensis]|uniref:GNAT family N-acetyltransferase n=1 Tax=Lacticaseibacillus hegangensis TaxID=2486010 RepID=A0ABW4CUK1_9LACO|nr:GNAT family protein [Lacticaseibacillus hegangensis]